MTGRTIGTCWQRRATRETRERREIRGRLERRAIPERRDPLALRAIRV